MTTSSGSSTFVTASVPTQLRVDQGSCSETIDGLGQCGVSGITAVKTGLSKTSMPGLQTLKYGQAVNATGATLSSLNMANGKLSTPACTNFCGVQNVRNPNEIPNQSCVSSCSTGRAISKGTLLGGAATPSTIPTQSEQVFYTSGFRYRLSNGAVANFNRNSMPKLY